MVKKRTSQRLLLNFPFTAPENSTTVSYIKPSSNIMASDTRAPTSKGKVREKIALKPGFHLADWKRQTQVMTKPPQQMITPEELARHNTQFDSWTAFQGKVYNITNYFPYHPGGDEILRQAAGKDCTDLFMKYHRWINCDSILGKVCVGTLVAAVDKINEEEEEEEETQKEEKETEIDDNLQNLKIDAISTLQRDEKDDR